MRYFLTTVLCALAGCVRIPEGIEPVKDFNVHQFLGKWYEVARLDNRFERGLQRGMANYHLRKDGSLSVINQGFNAKTQKWKTAKGKAYFVDKKNVGYLKVSFFGPFYGSYIIFDLGKNYEYALVTGSTRSYFWLLSRTPTIDDALQCTLMDKAAALGFATEEVIFVQQDDTGVQHSCPQD